MPFLTGWFLSMLLLETLLKFGLHPKYAIFWVFQLGGMLIITVAIQVLWVDKLSRATKRKPVK